MRRHLLWTIPLGLTVAVGLVLADEDSDRRNLISQIDSKLDPQRASCQGSSASPTPATSRTRRTTCATSNDWSKISSG